MKQLCQRVGAVALTSLALVLPSAPRAAVLDNADFEAGLSGWTLSGTVTVTATTEDVHGGLTAAQLADDSASLTATLASAVDVASISSFGFWARSDAGLLSLVVLSYSDGSDSGADVLLFDLGNTDWTYYDLSLALAAGKSLVSFTIYGSSAAASLIDDVALTTTTATVPEPASVALLLAGLGAVAWRRRLG